MTKSQILEKISNLSEQELKDLLTRISASQIYSGEVKLLSRSSSLSLGIVFLDREFELKIDLTKCKTLKEAENVIFQNILNKRNMQVQFVFSNKEYDCFLITNTKEKIKYLLYAYKM